MFYFILPDEYPISEWMFLYTCVAAAIVLITLMTKKSFLCKYLTFIISAIISVNVFAVGYKIDHGYASHGVRYKLNDCAIALGNKVLQEQWFALTQNNTSRRYEVYRQLDRCNKAMVDVTNEVKR